MSIYESLLDKLDGHKYSNYFTCCCIFHQDSSPSLFVYEDGRFRCAACGKRGTNEYLAKHLKIHSFSLTQRQSKPVVLPRWKRWQEQFGDLQGIADAAHRFLKKFHVADSYLKKRCVYEFLEKGCLGCLDGYVVIPVSNESGRILDLVVRKINGDGLRYCVAPNDGSPRPLYSPNWKRVQGTEIVYVVYGMLDAISLELSGLPVVTGITGKAINPESLQKLNKRFVIVPDLGEECEGHLLANQLGWRCQVKELEYEYGKDPNDLFVHFGKEYLQHALV